MRRYTIDFCLQNNLTLIGLDKACNDAQSCCFTASRGTEKSNKLLIADIEVKVFKHLIISEFYGNVF